VVALGGVRFLQKPLIREELYASLRDLFTVAGSQAGSGPSPVAGDSVAGA
jgi:hypothetical protein